MSHVLRLARTEPLKLQARATTAS